MSRIPSPELPADDAHPTLTVRVRHALRRARALLDGELADYPDEERERIISWQLRRTHRALAGMLATLAGFAAVKVVLLLAGLWPVSAPAWAYVVLLVVCIGMAYGYGKARSLTFEGITAALFVLAFLAIIIDPMTNWPDRPAKSLGILLMIPVIGLPLLVLLRSAVVFAVFCVVVAAAYFVAFPTDPATRYAVLLNLAIAVTAGLRLRIARSDMSAGFARSIQEALLHATTDALTGLLNRHGWSHAAPAALENATENGQPVTLLFLDLDHFKQLNDTHGHEAGDRTLRRMGRAITARLQSRAVAARIGGEEFVCLLPAHTPEQVHALVDRLRRDLANASPVATFSGGIARWKRGETVSQLMARADAALYRAKAGGRDCVLDAEDDGTAGTHWA